MHNSVETLFAVAMVVWTITLAFIFVPDRVQKMIKNRKNKQNDNSIFKAVREGRRDFR